MGFHALPSFHVLIFIISLYCKPNAAVQSENLIATFPQKDLPMQNGDIAIIHFKISGEFKNSCLLNYNETVSGVLENIPGIIVNENNFQNLSVLVKSIGVGHTVLLLNNRTNCSNMTDFSEAYTRVEVSHSNVLNYVSSVVGWVYFAAWSVSFYPQTFMNFRRKSVIGLHFDFLALNVVGFLYYAVFNIGLYWIPEIEREYFRLHKFGVNPVQLNDVIFAIHAFFACLIQVVQCMIYDRGQQKVSRMTRVLLLFIIALTAVMATLGSQAVFSWLSFLYFISYVKLFITLIKYIPQAYYNYRRKSTSGWSIGNVILDFTGGSLSIAQMFIIAYNFHDWGSIFGDPTKFGLGLFSMLFDVLFLVQHFGWYRNSTNNVVSNCRSDTSVREQLLDSGGDGSYGSMAASHGSSTHA